MKAKLLYSFLCLLFLLSCKEDEEVVMPAPQPAPAGACLMQKEVLISSAGVASLELSYDSLGRPVEAVRFQDGSLLSFSKYLYDTKGRLEREELLTPEREVTDYVLYKFNAQDQVVRYNLYEEGFDNSLLLTGTTTIQYDTLGRLTTVTAYDIRSNQPAYASASKYTYQDSLGQVTVQLLDQKKKKTRELILTFDDKKSYLVAVPAFKATVLTPGFPHEHNIKKCTARDAAGNLINSASYSRAFTYTVEGYVESATTTYLEGGEMRVSYSYHCL